MRSDGEHGTVQSYIVGFALSLVFTAIPYYLVVNKSVSGTGLLATILGFAVLQMLVQIFFFLHLGRGPKPLYNVVFFVSTVSLILVVVLGSVFIMNHLYHNMAPAEVSKKLAQDEGISQLGDKKTGACQGVNANHQVILKNGKASPTFVQAHHCDTLTFISQDSAAHEIGFGSHFHHESYAGNDDMVLRKGRPVTINLSQSGSYHFHDHLNPLITGEFAVTADTSTHSEGVY